MATNKWTLATLKPLPELWLQSGVYAIVNNVNGKYYVGSSNNMGNRKTQHWAKLRRGKGSPHLQAAWNLYGEEAFSFHALELCGSDIRIDREQRYIDDLDATNPELGYNIERDAKLGGYAPMGEATRQRISNTLKGHSVSDETRAKIGAARLGCSAPWNAKPKSEATKAKIAAAKVGVSTCNEQCRRKLSERAKELWAKRRELGLSGSAPLTTTTTREI